MEKTLVLVGMKDYKTAIEFMAVIADNLRSGGCSVKINGNIRMCLETPHAQIRFIYNPEYQQLQGLRCDIAFGLPEYRDPLQAYLKPGAVWHTNMGLVEWILTHEKACEDRDRYIRQDVATTNLAAAVTRAAKVISSIGRPRIKRVHFSGPVTCVIWSDGTKTLVRCGENDTVDYEKGLAMAIAKKVFGTNKSGSNYYDIFKQWLPKPEEKTFVALPLDADMIQTGTLCIECEEPTMEETEEVTPDV